MGMTQEQQQWVTENRILLTTSRRYSPAELQDIFNLYNSLTGERKKTTSCGRCIENVKKRILFEYDKAKDNN